MTAMSKQEIKVETTKMIGYKEDGVGWMIFNQPERRNAINREMREAIPVILESFRDDPEVRVVVMTGAGDKSFVSGADISEFDSNRATPEQIAEYNKVGTRASASYKTLNKPLIAMIRGFAVGGGLLTALKADLRVASDDSQFGIPAVRLGLGYGFSEVKPVVDLIGPANARQILITGDRVDAQTALRMGLINEVVSIDELEPRVRELSGTIARAAPLTVKAVSAAIDEAIKDEKDRDLKHIERLIADCFASGDYVEGRKAFAEKRQPEFRGV